MSGQRNCLPQWTNIIRKGQRAIVINWLTTLCPKSHPTMLWVVYMNIYYCVWSLGSEILVWSQNSECPGRETVYQNNLNGVKLFKLNRNSEFLGQKIAYLTDYYKKGSFSSIGWPLYAPKVVKDPFSSIGWLFYTPKIILLSCEQSPCTHSIVFHHLEGIFLELIWHSELDWRRPKTWKTIQY